MPDPTERLAARRAPPGIVFGAWSFAAAFLVLFVVQAVVSFRHVDQRREIGWTWVREGRAWHVREVLAGGPAQGVLEAGDVIVSVDGDPRIGVVGPDWVVPHAPPGSRYTMTVERGGALRTVELRQQVVPDPSYRAWYVLYLLTALAFAGVGVVIVIAKPDDPSIRAGFYGASLISFFYLWLASRPYDGVLQGWPLAGQLVLGSSFPLYLVGAYRFFGGFPENRPEEGFWRRVLQAVFVGALLVWVPRTGINLGKIPADSVDLVHAGYWLLRPYLVVGPVLETGFLSVVLGGTMLVMVRNYRRLPAGDLRRRIGWLATAMLFSTAFIAAASTAELAAAMAGAPAATTGFIRSLKLASNAMALSMPLTLGYAIARHRVMGIHLVVRLGLRYLLARTVLQVAVALPAIWLAWTLISRPDATVGQLLFEGQGRVNLAAVVLGAVLLRYRKSVRDAVDRRFFREAYDRDQILVGLADAVKELDSVQEIARMVCGRIDRALHVTGAVILFRREREARFVVGYSTDDSATPSIAPATSGLITRLEDALRPLRWDQVRPACPPHERAWLERLGVELIVPILGVNQDLMGLLLLGAKKSEEPYTPRDRVLLEAITAQVGAVCEVLSLRERVTREQQVRREVLGRLSDEGRMILKECPACGRCYDRDDLTCVDDGAELEVSLPVERTVAARYHLERLLGRGAMGAVFEATDLRLQRTVAVKVMVGALFGDQAAQRRFAREALAAARLTHPNIVRVYDCGALEGEGAYLVMERVDGVTLATALRERGGWLPPSEAVPILDQLLEGMHAAHEAGVVHRDLKPQNVVLCGDRGHRSQVKILDFGLAKIRESGLSDPKSATASGQVLGTPGYMSPEQFFGDEVDQRADVYSLAVMALETLTGPVAHRGYAVHERVREQVLERLQGSGASEASRALGAILLRGLAWEREHRYGTVAALRDELTIAVGRWEGPTSGGAA